MDVPRFMLVADPYYRNVLEKAGYEFDVAKAEIRDKELSDARKTAIFNSFVRAFNANDMMSKKMPVVSLCSYLGVGNTMVGITRDEEATKKACMSMSDAWVSMHCAASVALGSSIATECGTLDMRMKHIDMDVLKSIMGAQKLHEKPGSLSIDFVKEWTGNIELMKGFGRDIIEKAISRVLRCLHS
jgi:predicted house-cleaning NTP pyrophosphatase (Maf/HAM1 superfamily)